MPACVHDARAMGPAGRPRGQSNKTAKVFSAKRTFPPRSTQHNTTVSRSTSRSTGSAWIRCPTPTLDFAICASVPDSWVVVRCRSRNRGNRVDKPPTVAFRPDDGSGSWPNPSFRKIRKQDRLVERFESGETLCSRMANLSRAWMGPRALRRPSLKARFYGLFRP